MSGVAEPLLLEGLRLAAATRGIFQKGLEVCYCLWGSIQTLAWVQSWARPGHIPGPKGSRPDSPCALFTAFRTQPGPEVGGIPACPGPILAPSVPSRIGPERQNRLLGHF